MTITNFKINKTNLESALLIELKQFEDERGIFSRLFCEDFFFEKITKNKIVQVNFCENIDAGTLRGLHFQTGPYAEDKFIYCVQGEIFDTIVDLRKDSKTYLKSFSVKLAGFDNYMLYVPRGFAHGYITLRNHSNIVYLSTNFYSSKHESGIRYNDPLIGIKWPNKVTKISEKDRNWDFIIE